MVRSGGVDDAVLRARPGPALGELLEPALGALQARNRGNARDLGVGQGRQPVPRAVIAELEVEGAGESLERRCQDRWSTAAASLGLALAEGQGRPQLDPVGQ